MKLHRKRMSRSTFATASIRNSLAAATLVLSATALSFTPVQAQSAPPVTLQCQVSPNSSGNALSCSGTIPDGSGVLSCQSPNVISNNNGVITAGQAACSGTLSLAGVTVPGTLSAAVLVIDTNNGTISVSQGAGTLTVYQGLSTLTATCNGSFSTLATSPLTLDVPNGGCSANLNVLGVGNAQLAYQSGSVSLANSSIVTITSPGITLTTSLLGLPVTSMTCGATIPINLTQLPSISGLLTLCKGS